MKRTYRAIFFGAIGALCAGNGMLQGARTKKLTLQETAYTQKTAQPTPSKKTTKKTPSKRLAASAAQPSAPAPISNTQPAVFVPVTAPMEQAAPEAIKKIPSETPNPYVPATTITRKTDESASYVKRAAQPKSSKKVVKKAPPKKLKKQATRPSVPTPVTNTQPAMFVPVTAPMEQAAPQAIKKIASATPNPYAPAAATTSGTDVNIIQKRLDK